MSALGRVLAFAALALGSALVGCRPPPAPLDLVVAAKNTADFNHWRYRQAHTVQGALEKEFDHALQQLRYGVMAVETGLPPAEIDRQVHATIHGRTVREVIVAGYVIERRRIREGIQGEEKVLDFQHRQLSNSALTDEDLDLLMKHMEQVRMRQSEKVLALHDVDERITALTGQPADQVERAHKIRQGLPEGTAL